MRIRKSFAFAFALTLLLCALLGFSPPTSANASLPAHSDKALHAVAFFLTTFSFYWILDTTRRRVLQLTFVTCTLGLGVGSEVVQGWLPIHRAFDPYDILANLLGSALALTACTWYHRRMLERRRSARGYAPVVGHDQDNNGHLQGDEEAELGLGAQELGVVRPATVEDELERWEEGEEWETAELDEGEGKAVAAATAAATR